jgi:hypothetical protein
VRQKHIISTAAVALGILLGATACSDSTPATAKPAKASSSAKASTSAKAADAADAAEQKWIKVAQTVLTQSTDSRFIAGGGAGFQYPSGNGDSTIAADSGVVVEVACGGTGSIAVHLTSGTDFGQHEVSETLTCAEGATTNHRIPYRLAGKGLMVAVDPAKGSAGGYAYAVLKA